MPKSSTLSLAMRGKPGKDNNVNMNGPMSPKSPKSPTHLNGTDLASPHAPFHNNHPESPASPKPRKESKNIFANFSSGNKSGSSRMFNHDNSSRQLPEAQPSPVYSNGRGGNSTPDLNRPVQTPTSDDHRSENERVDHRTGSGASNEHSENADPSQRNNTKSKKQGGMLSRTRSIKGEENSGTRTKLNKAPPPQLSPDIAGTWSTSGDNSSLKTAPLEKGQSWRSRVGGQSKLRTHSADGHDSNHRDEDHHSARRDRSDQISQAGSSYNEHKGGAFMSGLRSGARDVGGKLGSAKKGIFQKLGRSSSSHETPTAAALATNEPYQFKVIHRPLVEQTRATRISSRLEQSRDKTEFWMPSLPWRCIDYLNMRGCEEEGLYRVPGSAQQVKYYERKFDTDGDIDLISDPNLNDPNVIGSLFKGWLRQLPDDIFPKDVQARIQQQCQGAKATPQMLKDELSRLPPYNYYLLFAITCHISLLHSCSEFNKMNYNNLCICFQPAIRIDAFCFQFLILDWRNCWQGCWTEKDYLAEEMAYLQSLETQGQHQTPAHAGNHVNSHVGHIQQMASKRSESVDRNGRTASPAFAMSESSRHLERDSSTERTVSSSGSREAPNTHGTPKRSQPSVSTDISIDGDDQATPTQATLHNRGQSDSTQFRLDLSNPPSSPFNIKF